MGEYPAGGLTGGQAGGNFGVYKYYYKKKRLDCRDRRRINNKNQY